MKNKRSNVEKTEDGVEIEIDLLTFSCLKEEAMEARTICH